MTAKGNVLHISFFSLKIIFKVTLNISQNIVSLYKKRETLKAKSKGL